MRLVSIDIDPQNRANRIHLGPFVAGLNAISGARGAGKSTIAKFIRGLLYNRHRDSSGYGQEAIDGLIGSLQWADTTGTSRVISSADSSTDRDYSLDGPYHFGRQNSVRTDGSYPQSSAVEQPWHRIGGEIYDAVFCGRLGETLPERLWQAARELGIHVATGHQHDETYRRLKAEQHRLEQRLHHLRVDDRDRAWWAAERARLVSRAEEIRLNPERHMLPVGELAYARNGAVPNSAVYREWESQLIALRAELSESDARLADLSGALLEQRHGQESTQVFADDTLAPPTNGRYNRSSSPQNDHYGTWVGYAKQRVAPKYVKANVNASLNVADLQRDQEAIGARKLQIIAEIADLQNKLNIDRSSLSNRATSAWELEEIQQRILYAEEVLKSWDLYETTRRRLAEVQQQLRGNGPYHDAVQGSFLQTVERYVRELSAGSLRRLPTWALEALRRDLGFASGLSQHGRAESYREVYRDYRPDLNRQDYAVPPSQSSERQLVELALRMAICDSAAHRIGRLPLILDDALDGFHGATLDHLVRVLIEFAREGQQVLLMTSEPEVAQRVRGHHGWVAQLNSPIATVAAPAVEIPSYFQPAVQPSRHLHFTPAALEGSRYYEPSLLDINAQLSEVAELPFMSADGAWYESTPVPIASNSVYRFTDYPRWNGVAPYSPTARPITRPIVNPAVRKASSEATYYLSVRSPIEDGPSMTSHSTALRGTLASGLRSIGIQSVGTFLNADPVAIANRLAHRAPSVDEIADRQAEQRLMCTVPNLRAFDARILVGCGSYDTTDLASIPPGRLLKTVERFLSTSRGQDILRSGNNYEVARMTTWLASAGRSTSRHRVPRDSRDRHPRTKTRIVDGQRRRSLRDREPVTYVRTRTSAVAPSIQRADRPLRETVRTVASSVIRPSVVQQSTGHQSTGHQSAGHQSKLRFYLDIDSPVVDAPSIGPKIVERLNALGIRTVNDLLRANAATFASQLGDKRISTETILEWQQQATLVCRVPNIRGHDAQQLVASGITTAEQLASCSVSSLVGKIATFTSSKAGQRLLRGAPGADEAEVRDWIQWASSSRTLRAA